MVNPQSVASLPSPELKVITLPTLLPSMIVFIKCDESGTSS